jgi:hypothetical protein
VISPDGFAAPLRAPWSIEEHGASNGQMWPYYINMN